MPLRLRAVGLCIALHVACAAERPEIADDDRPALPDAAPSSTPDAAAVVGVFGPDASTSSVDAAVVMLDAPSPREGAQVDAATADLRPVADAAPDPGLCARPTCGGDPTGTWEMPAWCSQPEGSGTGVGTLVFKPDGTYAWTLTSSTLPRHQAKATPETGTWRVSGNMLVTKITTSNGVVFPPRGSLVYRGDLGASSLFCVSGDTLTIRAEEKVGFNWRLRRAR